MTFVMGKGRSAPGTSFQNFSRAAVAAAPPSVQANRVYVGNLPYAVGWRELKDFMREAGEVSFAEVLMAPDGRSKGCGVVEFATNDAAQKAIAELSDKNLFGRPVFIREDREAVPRYGHQPPRTPSSGGAPGRQLFVSGLPTNATWQTLKDAFQAAGSVVRADVKEGRGTGIVLMSSEAEAANAIAMLNGSSVEGSIIQVREDRLLQNPHGGSTQGTGWVDRPAEVDPANQEPSTQIFVKNLPYSADTAELLALCPRATTAEVLSMGGRSKGIAVLEFPSLEASAEAIESLQGQVISGRAISVKYNERPHEFSDQAIKS